MRSILNWKLFCENMTEKEEMDYFNSFSEDLHRIVFDYVEKYDLTTTTAKEMFKPGTDFFVSFIESLEEYKWFDYKKLNYFLKEFNSLIDSIDDMREEGLFDEDDEYKDDETEEY